MLSERTAAKLSTWLIDTLIPVVVVITGTILLIIIGLGSMGMFWYADTTTQRTIAMIAVPICGFGVYDLLRPSEGDLDLRFPGMTAFLITGILEIIFLTTLF